ncbi:MAG: methyltransferase domain-containing protein [Candidatus Tectomicrobia bacterium]|uniref:Methyltransferase domain-containing protein n=1 Tax=Tectimicrobiota bacterium TaxID=2528274 RepID=A0A933E994_UNCTE|nr:methyltransferase domain-containing protein [Candidatus Tectomicrobia bacterium]MBI2179102.1 methyltransferase domain-containing protein [Candidatus Tectomicrobia bacterium]MBI4251858.1 methyltransferase domain-containing protein [Candidatus Tectomicrobia bacterium]
MLTADSVVKIYDRWGRFYDIVFKWIFSEGRNVGVELLDLKAGERLLEVGVGTGLSLPLYRRDSPIVGIDISSKMLEKAREKVDNLGLRNVDLQVMDAQAMTFPDDSFDCVTACYVVSAAPDPHKVVSEICRVCKPGGRIVFINHFKSQNRLLARFEELINGICRKFGWETTLDLETLIAAHKLVIGVQERVNIFDYWRAVLCYNSRK